MQKRNLLVLAMLAGVVTFAAPGPIATACPLHNRHAGAVPAAAAEIDMPAEGSIFYLGRFEGFTP